VQSEGKDSDAVVLECWPSVAGSQYNRKARPRFPSPLAMPARQSPSPSWVSVPISAFEPLPFHNPLAVREAPTGHILLLLLFPSAVEPAKDRWGRR
jgi:hypothetical protein